MVKKTLNKEAEEELRESIEKIINLVQVSLTKQEIREVIGAILPDIDKLISDKVKQHFIELAEFTVNKFKNNN